MRWSSASGKTEAFARHSRESGNPAPFVRVIALLASSMLGACSTVGYYAHLAHGELSLMSARRPIDKVIADPATDPKLKAKLELAEQARAFASDHLGLPRNGSYTRYADLHRPYAMFSRRRNFPSNR
jgi:predicted aminopeptidase